MAMSVTVPVVFVNIGWMRDYAGATAGDPMIGGHGHLRSSSVGHEAWNFQPHRGRVYGYIPRNSSIALERLGASKKADTLDGVTVIWVARNPRNSKTYIIGWFEGATLHRRAQGIRLRRNGGFDVFYQVVSPATKATLLKADARLFPIPTAKEKGNLGQSPVWYGKDDAFRSKVLTYVAAGGVVPATKIEDDRKGGSPRQPDAELRKRIELAAVNHATNHYQSTVGGSRTIRSVEAEGKGWDLEAIAFDKSFLKVEVKGLQGKAVLAELTSNEYSKMLHVEHREDYIVYIVTDALGKKPIAHIFRFDAKRSKEAKAGVWVTDDGRVLNLQPVTAARISC
jgi:hypothetical protein